MYTNTDGSEHCVTSRHDGIAYNKGDACGIKLRVSQQLIYIYLIVVIVNSNDSTYIWIKILLSLSDELMDNIK